MNLLLVLLLLAALLVLAAVLLVLAAVLLVLAVALLVLLLVVLLVVLAFRICYFRLYACVHQSASCNPRRRLRGYKLSQLQMFCKAGVSSICQDWNASSSSKTSLPFLR